MNINYIDFSNTTRFHDDGDVPYITFRKFDGLDFIKHGFPQGSAASVRAYTRAWILPLQEGMTPMRCAKISGLSEELLISGRKIWSMQCRRTQPT